jgi:hypothetical protein
MKNCSGFAPTSFSSVGLLRFHLPKYAIRSSGFFGFALQSVSSCDDKPFGHQRAAASELLRACEKQSDEPRPLVVRENFATTYMCSEPRLSFALTSIKLETALANAGRNCRSNDQKHD